MAQRVNVAIASPGDVADERNAVMKVFNRWNSANTHVFLHGVMWEFASVPTLGDHPQHLLNRQIIDASDLLVAILWSKLGTPTPTARSGTEEEIKEFVERKGPGRVMLYFCKRNLPYDIDAAELARLREFKQEMQSKGLYHEYGTVEQFALRRVGRFRRIFRHTWRTFGMSVPSRPCRRRPSPGSRQPLLVATAAMLLHEGVEGH